MKKKHPPQNLDIPRSTSPGEDVDDEQGGSGTIVDYALFVVGAITRRKLLAAGVFTLIAGGSAGAYWSMPRSYHAESQILAQKNQMIGTLAGRNNPADSPTRAASETVLRHDNLVALVQKTELVAGWDRMRSRGGRLKDQIFAKLGRSGMTDEDKADALLWMLQDRLSVKTAADWGGEGTVTFAIDWPDARLAYRLVAAAQESFIEDRHLSETASISEALSLLLSRAASLRDEIEATAGAVEKRRLEKTEKRVEERQARRERHAAAFKSGDTPEPLIPAGPPAEEKEAVQQLKALWEGKKAAIKELEDMRARRIAELQTRLTEQRATYGESHPIIVDTTQSIEALSQESPQLVQLRKQEDELHHEYLNRTGRIPEPSSPPGEGLERPILHDNRIRSVVAPLETDDREIEFAKKQLRFQMETYDRLMERIDGANMELQTARVAFKHRYLVIRPPQVPRTADQPKPGKVLGAGLAAALVLALLAAAGADLRTGRIFQRWQIERSAGIPVIAEIQHDS
jgi:uncharacterized protein involved in exopolysaccharide biosynthesis